MTSLPPHSIGTTKQLCKWAKDAQPGEFVIYHAGTLSLDRQRDSMLNLLADTVHLLQETNFVSATSRRTFLQIMDVWAYTATRTGRGFAPASILDQKLTSFEWRALRAIRDRDPDISATRAIRDALSAAISTADTEATKILETLQERKLVIEAAGKGWELSKAGLAALT